MLGGDLVSEVCAGGSRDDVGASAVGGAVATAVLDLSSLESAASVGTNAITSTEDSASAGRTSHCLRVPDRSSSCEDGGWAPGGGRWSAPSFMPAFTLDSASASTCTTTVGAVAFASRPGSPTPCARLSAVLDVELVVGTYV